MLKEDNKIHRIYKPVSFFLCLLLDLKGLLLIGRDVLQVQLEVRYRRYDAKSMNRKRESNILPPFHEQNLKYNFARLYLNR